MADSRTPLHETLKNIKHSFFTFRNGMLADTLRGYGDPHKIIFGLEVPRIAEIARGLSPDKELAQHLWSEKDNRESRLLATYLFPVNEVNIEHAVKLAGNVTTREEADMLAFRLFKRLPFGRDLLEIFRQEIQKDTIEAQAFHLSYLALHSHFN